MFIQELYEGWGNAIKKGWYLHMLRSHLPAQMKRLGGSIYMCSCSEQERLNGKHTKLLLNCIQKHNSLDQLMQKQASEIYFQLHPDKQKKRNTHQISKKKNPSPRKGQIFATETMDQQNKQNKAQKERATRKTAKLF